MDGPAVSAPLASSDVVCTRLRQALPAGARAVVEALLGQGAQVFVVGGAVRDAFLGRGLHDWDLATDFRPEQVVATFAHVVRPGRSVRTLIVVSADGPVEVTSFAQASTAGGNGEADTLAQDLSRRDFTLNAMAVDTRRWALLDPHAGLADVRARLIRCVGDPATRFAEDPLRCLRAARFVGTLGFACDPATAAALPGAAAGLRQVAWERKRMEMLKLLGEAETVSPALALLAQSGLLVEVAPELSVVQAAELPLLDDLPVGNWLLRFAGWAALAGLGPLDAAAILRRWRVRRSDADRVVEWLQAMLSPVAADASREAQAPPRRHAATFEHGVVELQRALGRSGLRGP